MMRGHAPPLLLERRGSVDGREGPRRLLHRLPFALNFLAEVPRRSGR